MICERCGEEFEEDWRRDSDLKKREPKPRFCSRRCANSRTFSTESRLKKSKASRSDKNLEALSRRKEQYLERSAHKCTECDNLIRGSRRKTCSDVCFASSLRRAKPGRSHISNGKSVSYRGITLGSSYEELVARSLDENNVLWERPKNFKWFDDENRERRYFPDFYLPEYDVYLDPKNDFLINNPNPYFGILDCEKIRRVEEANDIRVLILSKQELEWNVIKCRIGATATQRA